MTWLQRFRCLPMKGAFRAISTRSVKFPMLEPQRGIHARQKLARAWRSRRRPQARHVPPAPGRQDRHGLSRLRPADRRGGVGRQCRPDAGRQALRARQGLPPRHLCHVVDQGGDSRIHPAILVPREDGHHREPEEAVLQPAQGQGPHLRLRGRRPASRPRQADRHPARRDRAGCGGHEPPARRRFVAQFALARGRRRRGEWQDWLVDTCARARSRCSSRRRKARTG